MRKSRLVIMGLTVAVGFTWLGGCKKAPEESSESGKTKRRPPARRPVPKLSPQERAVVLAEVNGKKITTPQVIKSSDKLYIGDFTLQLSPQNGVEARPSQVRGAPVPEEDVDAAFVEAPPDAARRATGLIDEKFEMA